MKTKLPSIGNSLDVGDSLSFSAIIGLLEELRDYELEVAAMHEDFEDRANKLSDLVDALQELDQ